MRDTVVETFWNSFFEGHPDLARCREDVLALFAAIDSSLRSGGTLFVCGNGGSASDADHIVGELMKSFRVPRPLSEELRSKLSELPDDLSRSVLTGLEAPLRAMALGKQSALATAFANDVDPGLEFSQEILGYGRPGDVVLCLSTSGNSRNVVAAALVGQAIGVTAAAMTGSRGGRLAEVCDHTVRVPADETAEVQEQHLPIYHALCSALELAHFPPA